MYTAAYPMSTRQCSTGTTLNPADRNADGTEQVLAHRLDRLTRRPTTTRTEMMTRNGYGVEVCRERASAV